jgi:hypothetical protein
MTPEHIHKIATKMGISWDDDRDFMSWCQKTVGKKHLDDMIEDELVLIYNKIKNGNYQKPIEEKWSTKYKRSINCSKPKGFSQKAHCAGRKKRNEMYKEIKESDEIMQMMEDVFGHRVTTWTPKDTKRLKNKIGQPISDKEKEEYVDTVEPLMNKKSIIPKKKDKTLDAFVDLDTRISQKDYEPTIDLDDYKKQTRIVSFKKKEDGEKSTDEKEK